MSEETKNAQTPDTAAGATAPGQAGTAAPSDAEARVRDLEEELARLKDDKLRALAETENVKRRLMREKEEFQKFAVEGVLGDLLPVLDNLDMALVYAEKSDACKGFVQGVEMTRKVFLDILAGHGLEATGDVGVEFNPEWHEAVGAEPREDLPENHVCQLLQKGYKLKGRLLRPAKVLISKPC
jgi:molecular chaperone GrpE